MFGRLEMKENGITKVYLIAPLNNSVLVAYFGREKNEGSIHPMSLSRAKEKFEEKISKGYKLISVEPYILSKEVKDYFKGTNNFKGANNDNFLKYLNHLDVSPIKEKNINRKKAKKVNEDYYYILENF